MGTVMKPCIQTYSGITFWPLSPVVSDIRIEDIAHHLANQGRFSGGTRFRYCVAEHSVRVAEALYKAPTRVQLWGLMHDASEAYLIDLPTPLKLHPAFEKIYKRAERRLMRAICRRFGMRLEQPLDVYWADAALLATEVRDLMHPDSDYWQKLTADPLPGRIRPWGADVAEFEFLEKFKALKRELKEAIL